MRLVTVLAASVAYAASRFGLSERVGCKLFEHFEKILGNEPFRALEEQRDGARRFVGPEEIGHRVEGASGVVARADAADGDGAAGGGSCFATRGSAGYIRAGSRRSRGQ